MGLEDKFVGKKVTVEAQIFGGAGDKNVQQYEGTYVGQDTLFGEDVLILEKVHYFCKANIVWSERKDNQATRVCVNPVAIPTRHILSVGIIDDEAIKQYITK